LPILIHERDEGHRCVQNLACQLGKAIKCLLRRAV
jgi:hypothetical protein